MIITQTKYDGNFIHGRFAYEQFRKNVSPYGDIVAFRAPMDVSTNLIDKEDLLSADYIHSDDALNFCWEIPNLCPLGAVAFQRHLNTFIGTSLSKLINRPIEVDGDDLMVHSPFKKFDNVTQQLVNHDVGKCSVSITYSKNNVTLGHTGININAGLKSPSFAYSTHLSDEQVTEFATDVITWFNLEVADMFVATTKITL